MSLSHTSFANAAMASEAKVAMHRAAFGHDYAVMRNRKGEVLCTVRYHKGEGFTFYRGNRNISELVIRGIRRWHLQQGRPLTFGRHI